MRRRRVATVLRGRPVTCAISSYVCSSSHIMMMALSCAGRHAMSECRYSTSARDTGSAAITSATKSRDTAPLSALLRKAEMQLLNVTRYIQVDSLLSSRRESRPLHMLIQASCLISAYSVSLPAKEKHIRSTRAACTDIISLNLRSRPTAEGDTSLAAAKRSRRKRDVKRAGGYAGVIASIVKGFS